MRSWRPPCLALDATLKRKKKRKKHRGMLKGNRENIRQIPSSSIYLMFQVPVDVVNSDSTTWGILQIRLPIFAFPFSIIDPGPTLASVPVILVPPRPAQPEGTTVCIRVAWLGPSRQNSPWTLKHCMHTSTYNDWSIQDASAPKHLSANLPA